MAIKPFGDIVHPQNESKYIVTEEFINSGDAKNPITKSHSIVMVVKAFTKGRNISSCRGFSRESLFSYNA